MKKPLNKQELLQIINNGWDKRREASIKRRMLNSLRAALWKSREKNKTIDSEGVKRQKHYLQENKNRH